MDITRKDIQNSKEFKNIKNLINKQSIFSKFKNLVFGNKKSVRSSNTNNINYAGNILSVVISGLLVYYVMKLEYMKCHCSTSRKREYIKYFNIVFAIIILGITGITYYNDNFTTKKNQIYSMNFDYTITFKNIFVIILFLCSIINIFCIYTYIRELKENECLCALEANDDIYLFLHYYSLIQLLTLMFFMVIIMMSSLSITY
jgi:hypothetical protein